MGSRKQGISSLKRTVVEPVHKHPCFWERAFTAIVRNHFNQPCRPVPEQGEEEKEEDKEEREALHQSCWLLLEPRWKKSSAVEGRIVWESVAQDADAIGQSYRQEQTLPGH